MPLSDKNLYELCKKYGASALLWRRKFIGLLPEVNRRRLYEKKGFQSIFEFAAKLCGLSAEQVRLALNLEKRFEDKPVLKKMLENGEASINKLTRVVSIATPENEEELAETIKLLSKNALETLVRDEKIAAAAEASAATGSTMMGAAKNKNTFQKPFFDNKDLPGQTVEALKFQLADDITEELNELHAKGIDVNELLRAMLKRRKEEIAEEKENLAAASRPTKSRYIPVKIKRILRKEYGKKCSMPTCPKTAATIHHTQRFGLSQNHDPRFLAPLCEDHHAIAHSIDLKYQRVRAVATG